MNGRSSRNDMGDGRLVTTCLGLHKVKCHDGREEAGLGRYWLLLHGIWLADVPAVSTSGVEHIADNPEGGKLRMSTEAVVLKTMMRRWWKDGHSVQNANGTGVASGSRYSIWNPRIGRVKRELGMPSGGLCWPGDAKGNQQRRSTYTVQYWLVVRSRYCRFLDPLFSALYFRHGSRSLSPFLLSSGPPLPHPPLPISTCSAPRTQRRSSRTRRILSIPLKSNSSDISPMSMEFSRFLVGSSRPGS
jgi:hypothetical protein